MSEVCGNPDCTDETHWTGGGCSAYLRRKRAMDVGPQRAAPKSLGAVRASQLASTIAIMGLPCVASALERAFKPTGNNFRPCDKCGKPSRDARCFKCRTLPRPTASEG